MKELLDKAERLFDERFGKMPEGKLFGDDLSEGAEAGCDDCSINQKLRHQHKLFLHSAISSSIKSALEEIRLEMKPIPNILWKDQHEENMTILIHNAIKVHLDDKINKYLKE